MKDDQLELNDTEINSDVSDDLGPEEFLNSLFPDNIMQKEKNDSTSNGFEEKHLEELSGAKWCKSPKVYQGKRTVPTSQRSVHGLIESPQPWSAHARTCSTPRAEAISNPNIFFHIPPEMKAEVDEVVNIRRAKRLQELSQSSSIDSEDLYKKVKVGYTHFQNIEAELENMIKTREQGNLYEKDQLKKILSCYKQMTMLVVNTIKELKSSEERKNPEKQNLDSEEIFKNGENESEQMKAQGQVKTFLEKYFCTVAFTFVERKNEITSVSILQMNRVMDGRADSAATLDIKHSKMSLSSGSLADHSSISESNSVNSIPKLPFPLPGRHSIPESSSTSSTSSININRLRHSQQFSVPISQENRVSLHSRKSCYCKCFCSLLKQYEFKRSVESLHSVQDSSLENSNPKVEVNTSKEPVPSNKDEFSRSRELLSTFSTKVNPIKGLQLEPIEKADLSNSVKEKNVSSTSFEDWSVKEENSEEQQTDLLVFARWASKYYPGKIERTSIEAWHDAEHLLNVNFFDGMFTSLANVFIIPATMLPSGIEIMCNVSNNLYEEGTLVRIERLIDLRSQESLQFVVNIDEEIRTLPIEKVWFNESTKKHLGITPRKPQVMPIGTPWSLVQGKRQRRTILSTPYTSAKAENSSTSIKTVKTTRSVYTAVQNSSESTISLLKKKGSSLSLNRLKRKKLSSDKEKTSKSKGKKKLEFEQPGTTSVTAGNFPGKIDASKSSETVISRGSSLSLKRLKRPKSTSEEENTSKSKGKKIIKKLEFEPQPGTSMVSVKNIPEKVLESKSSETELSDTNWNEYIEVSDLDTEYMPAVDTAKKSIEPGKIKSKGKIIEEQEDVSLVNTLGPICKSEIFKGYNFVLTHSNSSSHEQKAKESIIKSNVSSADNEETGTSTDVEEQIRSCAPFDYLRLKTQIKAGGGFIYRSIAEINATEFPRTVTISDYPCQTSNYLLSIALRIPVYRHDLIINCCKENVPITRMLKLSSYMPTGRSLENGTLVERRNVKSKKPLHECVCAINIKTSFKFWRTLLTSMGATVLGVNRDVSDLGNNISFILADKSFSRENYNLAMQKSIPVISKIWVIQTLIHGEPRMYLDYPEYTQISCDNLQVSDSTQ